MAQHSTPHTDPGARPGGAGEEPTIGALVHDLSQEIPELVRSEIRLAQLELTEKSKQVGTGLGMFSASGLVAFFGLATLIATAVLGLAEALPGWLAALIVAVALLAVAGVLALLAKKKVDEGQPMKPERAIAGVHQDVETVKGATR